MVESDYIARADYDLRFHRQIIEYAGNPLLTCVYSLAPVFDNGSCLFPSLVDEDEMLRIIGSEEETRARVYGFPTSQIRLRGRKSSYYEVVSSLEFDECNRALCEIVKRTDMDAIHRLVTSVPGISDRRKAFYDHMLEARYRCIIEAPYQALVGRNA